ncbi:MAG: Wzt carbohydrate-binding domain-containing protein, partial [Lachnospiraceae bacterium]|nr:Wzt carbohydrate-binding domain-containing protein [Lachnospiraceae bacterium]
MDLQGGQYLICLGCTGYQNDEFVVYHRLYDLCSISVISDKNTVGFFDMNTHITVSDPGEDG